MSACVLPFQAIWLPFQAMIWVPLPVAVCKVCAYMLFAHKMRTLGYTRLVYVMRVCVLAGAVVFIVALWSNHVRGVPSELMMLLGTVLFAMAYIIGLPFMTVTALPYLRSSSMQRRRVGAWVMLTSVVCLASFMSFLFALYMLVVTVKNQSLISVGFLVVWSIDFMIDCSSVVLFSGLIGPAQLQRLSQDAFVAINAYSEYQLQNFYEQFLEYLDVAKVKWVRCGFLRRLAAAGPRCPVARTYQRLR